MKEVEYEEENGVRIICRTYDDTYVASLWVEVQCPYCGYEQDELDKTNCGETYEIECDACEKTYEMYFDHP